MTAGILPSLIYYLPLTCKECNKDFNFFYEGNCTFDQLENWICRSCTTDDMGKIINEVTK